MIKVDHPGFRAFRQGPIKSRYRSAGARQRGALAELGETSSAVNIVAGTNGVQTAFPSRSRNSHRHAHDCQDSAERPLHSRCGAARARDGGAQHQQSDLPSRCRRVSASPASTHRERAKIRPLPVGRNQPERHGAEPDHVAAEHRHGAGVQGPAEFLQHAEYVRSAGIITINAVTKPGSNGIPRIGLRVFCATSGSTRRNFFRPARADTSRSTGTSSAIAPARRRIKNRTFFFTSYEGRVGLSRLRSRPRFRVRHSAPPSPAEIVRQLLSPGSCCK